MFRSCRLLLALACIALTASISQGQSNEYRISAFDFQYGNKHDDLPPVAALNNLSVTLGTDTNGFTAPGDGATETVRLGNVPSGSQFDGLALLSVMRDIVNHYKSEGYAGVYVVPAADQINPRSGKDLREGSTTLKLVVWVSKIGDVRTVAKGDRLDEDETINNWRHNHIVENSPLNPTIMEPYYKAPSLFNQEDLEEYLYRLNRHPARRVDTAISASDQPGEIVLDYLVTEDKPWMIYAQASNTGTESVGEWRERFGFVDYQFTNADDILLLDYVTTSFTESNSVLGSYTRPLINPNYLSGRVYGNWSQFTASDLGAQLQNYEGNSWSAGGELIASPIQFGALSIDFIGGYKYEHIEVTNNTLAVVGGGLGFGQADFQIFNFGSEIFYPSGPTTVRAGFMGHVGWTGATQTELDNLGRLDTASNYFYIDGYVRFSTYLDPLFFGADWKDLNSWQTSTLAHEVDLNVRWQWSPNRLIPQKELGMGGMFTVRGYPEIVAVGDTGVIANAEYRLHIPRLLKPYSSYPEEDRPEPLWGEFNIYPTRPMSAADWDLQFITFFDYGHTFNNDIRISEQNQQLMSTGVGVELSIMSNLNIQFAYGWVLDSLSVLNNPIDESQFGDSRAHFLATISW